MKSKRVLAALLIPVLLISLLIGCAGYLPEALRLKFTRSEETVKPGQAEESAESEAAALPRESGSLPSQWRIEKETQAKLDAQIAGAYPSSDSSASTSLPDLTVPLAPGETADLQAAPTELPIIPVAGITVTTERRTYAIGEVCIYSVSVFPENATDASFAIAIDGGAVESDDGGLLCTASGSATITAVASNNISRSVEITIVDLSAFAAEVFRLTNVERENLGLSALTQNSALTATAAVRAEECVVSFSHTRPNGTSCFTAFAENNVNYIRAAENIAYGQATPSAVVADWMDSPGHRSNILDPNLGVIGIGVELGQNGRLYWSQLFTN